MRRIVEVCVLLALALAGMPSSAMPLGARILLHGHAVARQLAEIEPPPELPAGGSTDTVVDVGGKSVTVPGTWIAEHSALVDAAGGDAVAALAATAANGRRSVAECYLLGVDPERADDDFKITRFWMDGDRPMFEFSHTRDGSGVSFEPRIRRMGKAALGDAWQEVPAGGNPAFRFFTVEVEPPR